MTSGDEYITIHVFHDGIQAELARAKFESEGLEARLLHGALSTVYPTPTGGVGGVRLQVPRDQLEFAEPVLEEFLARVQGTFSEDETFAAGDWREESEESGDGEAIMVETAGSKEGDAWMMRAAAGAMLGMFICPPIWLYSLWVLIAHHRKPRSAKGNWMLAFALVFNAVACAGWGLVLWSQAQTPPPSPVRQQANRSVARSLVTPPTVEDPGVQDVLNRLSPLCRGAWRARESRWQCPLSFGSQSRLSGTVSLQASRFGVDQTYRLTGEA